MNYLSVPVCVRTKRIQRAPIFPTMTIKRSLKFKSKITCSGPDSDQLGESFADWLGIEITAEFTSTKLSTEKDKKSPMDNFMYYLDGWSNTVSNCVVGIEDTHPDNRRRAQAITAVHPLVRSQLNCPAEPAEYNYCPPPRGDAKISEGTSTAKPGQSPPESTKTKQKALGVK